jgi:hypothetical protein
MCRHRPIEGYWHATERFRAEPQYGLGQQLT